MPELDLFSQRFRDHRAEVLSEALEHCPVAHSTIGDFFIVSKYADIVNCCRSPEVWSSRYGPGLAYNNPDAPGILVNVDPPEHQPQVRLLQQVFTSTYVRGLAPGIRDLARKLVHSFSSKGEIDVHQEYAVQIPLYVIATLLGIPFEGMVGTYRRWMLGSASAVLCDPSDTSTLEHAQEMQRELSAYFAPKVEEWAAKLARGDAEPDANLITRLLSAELDGLKLEMRQVLAFCSFLLVAGSGTTTTAITNLIRCLAEHPDQLAMVRKDRALVAVAVDESMRLETPIHGLFRTNNIETELRGAHIPANSKVMLAWAAGNLDPDYVDHPMQFDITRDPKLLRRQLTFGHGLHVCLGAALARMEAAIALEELLDGLPEFRLRPTGGNDGVPIFNTPARLVLEWDVEPRAITHVCSRCWHAYEAAQGAPDSGAGPGAPFSQLPETWVCPSCGAPRDAFEEE